MRVGLLAVVVWASALALVCGGESNDDVPTPATSAGGDTGHLVSAFVHRVVDGLTIDVEADGQMYRVRYLGIDTPENTASGDGERSIVDQALEFNRYLVEGKTVQLERGSVEANNFGNLLRYVYAEGEMVNKALLTNGYAIVADFPPVFRYQAEFLQTEQNARNNRRGFWNPPVSVGDSDPSSQPASTPVPPFEGGTLPKFRSLDPQRQICEYSGTTEPAIKGNVEARTVEKTYYVPGNLFYDTTVVDDAQGDRWFCSEAEAEAAGFKSSKR